MERTEKDEEIGLLVDWMQNSQIALCADYRGLSVSQFSTLRRELRNVGSKARVVKNTLARISAKKAWESKGVKGLDEFLGVLNGPSLLVVSNDDPVGPSKVLAKFAKDSQKLTVKGGLFENNFLGKAEVEQLATLPSREEVFGQLLRVISAPATQVVRLMQTPGTQMVRLLEEYRKKLEGASA